MKDILCNIITVGLFIWVGKTVLDRMKLAKVAVEVKSKKGGKGK